MLKHDSSSGKLRAYIQYNRLCEYQESETRIKREVGQDMGPIKSPGGLLNRACLKHSCFCWIKS